MAWKVVDYMEGQDGNPRFQSRGATVYGPLPVKVWVKVAGEKKHKLRPRPAGPRPSPISGDDAKAVQYARWLASRDMIQLPDGDPTVHWDGIRTAGRYSRRAMAVTFTGNGASPLSIRLPNWDWEPSDPLEETLPASTAFDDLLRRGLSILSQIAAPVDGPAAREMEAA